jgi:hypothetical protein
MNIWLISACSWRLNGERAAYINLGGVYSSKIKSSSLSQWQVGRRAKEMSRGLDFILRAGVDSRLTPSRGLVRRAIKTCTISCMHSDSSRLLTRARPQKCLSAFYEEMCKHTRSGSASWLYIYICTKHVCALYVHVRSLPLAARDALFPRPLFLGKCHSFTLQPFSF